MTRALRVILGEPPRVVAMALDDDEARKVAHHYQLVRRFLGGELSDDEFKERAKALGSVGGNSLLADPEAVEALAWARLTPEELAALEATSYDEEGSEDQ